MRPQAASHRKCAARAAHFLLTIHRLMNNMLIMRKHILILLLLLCLAMPCIAQSLSRPARAMLFSAVLPGGGQMYNKAWVKGGIVIGVQGWLIGSAIHNDLQRAHYHDLVVSGANPVWNAAREKEYQRRVNNDIWWIGITAVLSSIDAFVDAHLADFEEQDRALKLRFSGESLILEYRF